ncbi:uncharacterized protein LAESUDRAFT_666087, partial [Laetiporus sulphureus 93-53]
VIPPVSIFITLEPTIVSLTFHITSIHAKTLHSYVLSHLQNAPKPIFAAFTTFFIELIPPLWLHCVRCHKDYVEVKNNNRSCLVSHDDKSAEVKHIRRIARSGRLMIDPGTTYEMLWRCCGKLTEGDRDQGPLDGLCYERKHMVCTLIFPHISSQHFDHLLLQTNIKCAHFHTDSTPQDDKLTLCIWLNCHDVHNQLPCTNLHKQKCSVNLRKPSIDKDVSEGKPDSGADYAKSKEKTASKGKGKAKVKAAATEDEHMDVDVMAHRWLQGASHAHDLHKNIKRGFATKGLANRRTVTRSLPERGSKGP